MPFEIPLRSDLPAYQFLFDLEGKTYQLHFQWNARMGQWFISVKKQDGTDIVSGVRVSVERPLFRRFASDDMPPGQFLFIDTSGQQDDPGEGDLGARVILAYKESTE